MKIDIAMGKERTDMGGPPGGGAAPEVREQALLGLALAAAAGGVAHQVRNPLHAIAMQVALVSDKIGAQRDVARACATHLAKVKDQIGRIEEVVRRYVEAADPGPGPAREAGRLLADAAALFAHEANRRRVAIEVEDPPAGLRARADAARVERLWMGLVVRAVEEAGERGALRLSAEAEGGTLALALEYPRRDGAGPLAWVGPAVEAGALELGGSLEERQADGVTRAVLRLPLEGT